MKFEGLEIECDEKALPHNTQWGIWVPNDENIYRKYLGLPVHVSDISRIFL